MTPQLLAVGEPGVGGLVKAREDPSASGAEERRLRVWSDSPPGWVVGQGCWLSRFPRDDARIPAARAAMSAAPGDACAHFAAVCLALALLASGASAKVNGYSTPVNLSGKLASSSPHVAVDRDGRATVV